ncbi:MAG: murein hydrolase activator EnvC family protein [Eubacterium sp.]
MKKLSVKIISVIMICCFAFSAMPFNSAYAATKSTKALDSQRTELERDLAAIDKKLKELGSESKETEEYISALDEKISYLQKQYDLAKTEVSEIEKKVSSLENQIEKNETDITEIEVQVAGLEENIKTLNSEFESTYDAYCSRIRALYISGEKSSVLTFLLTSNGISNLLTRYEMISAVSKKDGELMQSVKVQTEKIVGVKDQLDEKEQELSKTQNSLKENRKDLEAEKVNLLEKQDTMHAQQTVIEDQQLEANKLLKRLNDKTKEYGEYRDITQEELDEIDAAIEEADKKYPVTTTTTTTTEKPTTTTKKPETTEGHEDKTTTKKPSATTTTKKPTTTTKKASSSKYISLTYPCPSYTKITCGFGAYSGHTGCDFSTNKHENQKIVAAEDGTVILVKLLEYSYGHYLVIRHDKTTSSGKVVYTLYAHNNDILVSEGQHVTKGQQIAKSGSTGNSTGPHCHFEVRVGGSSQSYAVNPANYLP